MGCPQVSRGAEKKTDVPLFFLGDEAFDCCMDQSRLQSDPGSECFFFFDDYPVSLQWVQGAILAVRELSRVLVFP